MVEEGELGRGQLRDILRRGGPAGLRVALPGADTAAWGVDEDAVEFRLGWEPRGAVPDHRAVVEQLCPGSAALEGLEAAGVAVAGPDDALVLHQIREVHRLAALAGAGVPPRLAGLRGAGDADHLRGKVLDFKLPGLELVGLEEVLDAGETEGVRFTI